MKKPIYITLSLLLMGFISCKNTNEQSESQSTTTEISEEERINSDTLTTSDEAGNGTTSTGTNAQNPNNSADGTGNGSAGTGSTASGSDREGMTQYRSEGRTESTAVNRAQTIQHNNRDNAAASKKKGYGAPDGTAAENTDGDMYTKHAPVPMPSGPPIK